MGIWLVAFLLGALAAIPYVIWMIATAVKKSWKKLGILVAIPLALFLTLRISTEVIDSFAYRAYLRGIYDTRVSLGVPVFEYHSERFWNGDGYSIQVYELPESIRKRFETVDESLLQEFPRRPSYRDDWSTEYWREAPMKPEFFDYLHFATTSYGINREGKLESHFANIHEAMNRNRTFYAFFKYDHGDYPGNIDMFIIDLEKNVLYEINHNT